MPSLFLTSGVTEGRTETGELACVDMTGKVLTPTVSTAEKAVPVSYPSLPAGTVADPFPTFRTTENGNVYMYGYLEHYGTHRCTTTWLI